MSDPTLIADLVRAGVDPDLVNRVALLMGSSADVRRPSTDASADRRRKKDAERKRAERKRLKLLREKEVAQANDGAATVTPKSADASADDSKSRPTFLSNLSLNLEGSSEEGSKEAKKARSENARARGQRMLAGAVLTDELRQAAVELGADPARVPAMWAEFADYWVAVPGARGVKLDWLATWRNDVRRKLERGNGNGRARQQSLGDYARDLAEQARSAERAAGAGRPDEPLRGH